MAFLMSCKNWGQQITTRLKAYPKFDFASIIFLKLDCSIDWDASIVANEEQEQLNMSQYRQARISPGTGLGEGWIAIRHRAEPLAHI